MGKTVIFIIIACVLIVVWSACVMAARADEKLREIMDDKKEPDAKASEEFHQVPYAIRKRMKKEGESDGKRQ